GDAIVCDAANNLERQDDQRRPGSECRSEKTRSNYRGIPERTSSKTHIQERRDGMNRHGPHDSKEHKWHVRPGRWPFVLIAAVQEVATDVQVNQQIAIQYDHIPTQHRARKIELSNAGY